MTEFEREVAGRIAANGADQPLQAAAHGFMTASIAARYSVAFPKARSNTPRHAHA